MNDLETRVARLENRLRNQRRLALASLAGVACLALAAAAPQEPAQELPQKLHVESLVVGDAEKARIELTTQADGSFLILYDETGKQRWRVAAKSRDPYWQLRDAGGRVVRKLP
ncbi:MAG: hypothetical protein WD066_13400 [Planctomycetaceae bacterium]